MRFAVSTPNSSFHFFCSVSRSILYSDGCSVHVSISVEMTRAATSRLTLRSKSPSTELKSRLENSFNKLSGMLFLIASPAFSNFNVGLQDCCTCSASIPMSRHNIARVACVLCITSAASTTKGPFTAGGRGGGGADAGELIESWRYARVHWGRLRLRKWSKIVRDQRAVVQIATSSSSME